jgi:NitT/TauT family transport system substrate-binding protein
MPALVAAATQKIVCTSLVQQGFTSIIANQPMFIGELRGKRIGYALGSNAHYGLLHALSSEGLSPKDVHLIPMDVAEMPEALETGSITAFSAWEPTPAVTLKNVENSVVIHRSLSSGYLYFNKETMRDHPEAVRYIIAAEIRAIRWMHGRRRNLLQASRWTIESGEKLFRRDWSLSPEEVATLSGRDLLQSSNAPIIPEKSLRDSGTLHQEFLFLRKIGKIPGEVSWSRVHESFDREAILDVLVHPEGYSVTHYKVAPETDHRNSE